MPPRHRARSVHGGLLLVVEIADEADELAEALDVESVEVDLVAAAGGPGSLGSPFAVVGSAAVGSVSSIALAASAASCSWASRASAMRRSRSFLFDARVGSPARRRCRGPGLQLGQPKFLNDAHPLLVLFVHLVLRCVRARRLLPDHPASTTGRSVCQASRLARCLRAGPVATSDRQSTPAAATRRCLGSLVRSPAPTQHTPSRAWRETPKRMLAVGRSRPRRELARRLHGCPYAPWGHRASGGNGRP